VVRRALTLWELLLLLVVSAATGTMCAWFRWLARYWEYRDYRGYREDLVLVGAPVAATIFVLFLGIHACCSPKHLYIIGRKFSQTS
jgi:hypothetical protein